ncbi:hypothetical protein AN958_02562 [Leucoagaricus sp. SymC.cos]|nr:hypothetical protein AN958_02562 [Leucoagaricus sp. SymC.cos]
MDGKAVLDRLEHYITPSAATNVGARWPPPSCHPSTRKAILEMVMLWLYGPAGCGKSAVAQSLAERRIEILRLGAAFFFSCSNSINKPETVFPALAYQLASHCPEYKTIWISLLTNEPLLLTKAQPVQFNKLIVEPFLRLQDVRE